MAEKIYYGWFIVAGLFCVLTVSSGLGFYNLSLYMNVLAEARGFAISEVSIAVSLFFVVGGISGIWVARLLERFDVRWVMVGGAMLGGLALGSSGHATSIWMLYLIYLLFGIGNSGVSIVVSTTLIASWFPGRNRSVALSVASTGLSLGGVLITPVSARLFDQWGLTATMPWLGVMFFLVILPVALWIVRTAPKPQSTSQGGAILQDGWAYADAVRSRFFLLMTSAFVICMGAQVGGIAHIYNRVEEEAGLNVAAGAVQALSFMSIVARLVGGVLVTRISIRAFALANLAGQAAGLAIIAVADSGPRLLMGAGIFGASVGNLLMLHPLWLAEVYGVRDYARIFSFSNAFTVIGVACGPLLLGILYDGYSYPVAYMMAVVLSLLAWLMMFSAGSGPAKPSTAETVE